MVPPTTSSAGLTLSDGPCVLRGRRGGRDALLSRTSVKIQPLGAEAVDATASWLKYGQGLR